MSVLKLQPYLQIACLVSTFTRHHSLDTHCCLSRGLPSPFSLTGGMLAGGGRGPACKLPELFILWSGTHSRGGVLSSLWLNQARPCLLSLSLFLSLTSAKVAFPRPLVRALALAASLRASSCTRRSPPPRRTIRIPISLPAFLSLCGCVRDSRSRWITCTLGKGREGISDRRCRPYHPSSVSLRRQRRAVVLDVCESPPGLSLQVCESLLHCQTGHSLCFGSLA